MERIIEIVDHGGPDGWHSYSFGEAREKVVRCKDCRHYADHEWIISPKYGLGTDVEHVCHFWHGEPTKVAADGFCAWGEKVVG